MLIVFSAGQMEEIRKIGPDFLSNPHHTVGLEMTAGWCAECPQTVAHGGDETAPEVTHIQIAQAPSPASRHPVDQPKAPRVGHTLNLWFATGR